MPTKAPTVTMRPATVTTLTVGAIIVLGLLIVASSLTHTVEDGNVGIRKTLGKISNEEVAPGFHFKKPFVEDISEVSTRTITVEDTAPSASKDQQGVTAKVSINGSINPGMAAELSREFDLKSIRETIFKPAMQESVKAVTAQYNAEQLIIQREQVRNQIVLALDKFLNNLLESKGVARAITIHSVAITDFQFSREFDAAIEAKVKAEQQAMQAKNEKEKTITEAEAKFAVAKLETDARAYGNIEQAKAEAASIKAKADAESYSLEIMSTKRAEALAREAQALADNPSVLQLRQIEAWDGKFPYFFSPGGGEGSMNMLFNMSPPQATQSRAPASTVQPGQSIIQ